MLDTVDNSFLQAPTTLRPCIWLLGLFFLVSSCSLNIIPHFSLLLWVTAPYPCVISMQSSHLSFSFPAVLTWLPVATSSRTHFVCVPHLVSFRTITLFKVLQLAPLSAVYRCLRSAASTPNISITVFQFLLQLLKGFPVFIFPSLLAHITGLALPTVTTIVATYLYWITYCTVYFIF